MASFGQILSSLTLGALKGVRRNAANDGFEAYTTGDVVGPASSTATAVPKYFGTGGKTLVDTGVTIDSDNTLTAANLVASHPTLPVRHIISATNNVAKILSWRTDNLPRWAARVDGDETGSEAGGDWNLRRYDDTGAFVESVLGFIRSTGVGTFTHFPITPSAAPTTNYQVANKKYIDDIATSLAGDTLIVAGDLSTLEERVSTAEGDINSLESAVSGKQTSIQLKDEGTNKGTAGAVSSINFVGNLVTLTETGGDATVTITDPTLVHFDVNNNLLLPKASGTGIKVDFDTPTFGWHDIIGDVTPKASGAGSPTINTFRGGLYRWYSYSAGSLCDLVFHIPHDYLPGSDLFVHLHWAHNGTAISGSFVTTFHTTYAKGHNQDIFPAEKVQTMTVSTPNIATIPQYDHRINEIQLSSNGGSATLLDSSLLEVDGIILMRFSTDTIPTITGGSVNRPFIFTCDIHYQSTGVTTKNRTPNFYT